MKQYVLLIVFLYFGQSEILAQQLYKTAIGGRVFPGGFTVKHFFSNSTAAEAMVHFKDSSKYASALVEFHGIEKLAPGMRFYSGLGPFLKFTESKKKYDTDWGGIASLGLDYKFKNLPVNASVDWFLHYYANTNSLDFRWFNLAVRYVLK